MGNEYFVSSFASDSFLAIFFLISSPLRVMPFSLPSSNRYEETTWINNILSLESWTARSGTVRPVLLSNNISYGGESLRFGCGFFCYSISCNKGYSFAVFFVIYDANYSDPDELQMVWTANRERLVQDNATLKLTSTGNLVLKDSDGTLVWSTGTSTQEFQGMVMEETGNLILLNNFNETLWQSFDHPTDVLLQGQKLKVGQKLTANTSPTNTSQGIYYATLLVNGFALFTAPAPPQMYYSYSCLPKTINLAYIQFDNDSVSCYPEGFPSNRTVCSTQIPLNSLYLEISSDGHLRFYVFEHRTRVSLHDYLSTFCAALGTCDYPKKCGSYGVCTDGQCSCPKQANAFVPIDSSKPDQGCRRRSPLLCPDQTTLSGAKSYEFLELDHVSYFSYRWGDPFVKSLVSREECKNLCLNNCSCTAAFFRYNISASNSSGHCYLESNDYTLKMNGPGDAFYNSTAYIKVRRCLKHSKRLAIGIAVSVGTGVVLLLFILWVKIRRSRKTKQKQKRDEIDDDGSLNLQIRLPQRFSFQELRDATDDFSVKLGGGGFGSVNEGVLSDGTKIAVKRLDRAGQGAKEFKTEVEILGNLHHVNLVRLKGFCAEKSYRMLIYEFLPNRSLDKWIFQNDAHQNVLDLKTRSKIAFDIAKALTYLHEQCQGRVIHLDIKPQNILLDEKFNAELSDFGLAKLIEGEQSEVMTMTRGTPGYMAPELFNNNVSVKADVFSFGIMLVEIVSGKRIRELSDGPLILALRRKIDEGRLSDMIDPRLENEGMDATEEAVEMLKLGMLCIHEDFTRRPSMSIVVKALEGMAEASSSSVSPLNHPLQSTTRSDRLEYSHTSLSSVLSAR